jgi:preprotein translocase subunit SecE
MATRTKTKGKTPDRSGTSRLASVRRLIRETSSEIKKVTWPDRETTRNLTIVVIAISTALGLVLGGIDALFVRLWEFISGL